MSPSDLIREFVSTISLVVGENPVALHEPVFSGNEKKYLAECIDSGYVSSVGSFVTTFENALCEFTGARHSIATVNGTTALSLALISLGVKPGDEVIVPAMSFVATANAVSHCGATPHFVDVDSENWGLSPLALRQRLAEVGEARGGHTVNKESGRPITAVIPMHTLGHPVAISEILSIAEEFGLIVVEDAAESLGSYVGEQHTGLFGALGVFSFNGNKTITTGGGGAVITNDDDLAAYVRHLSTTGRVPHPYEFDHDVVGYNFRMPNINAALGVAQMERLPELIARQRALYQEYVVAFEGKGLGVIRSESEGHTSNFWLQAVALSGDLVPRKERIIEACLSREIGVRPLWKPLNRLKPYGGHPSGPTPVAHDLYDKVLCLPSSATLVE